jgi:hypothetical protein
MMPGAYPKLDAKESKNVSIQNRCTVLNCFLTSEEQSALLSLAPRLAWEHGRQRTGYQKASVLRLAPQAILDKTLALLASFSPRGWDAYLLRYPMGSAIPDHVDPPLVDGLRHVRLNAIVQSAAIGGIFSINGEEILLQERDAVLFWPDQELHCVSQIEAGERLLWSVGCNYEVVI